jgi:hypothetical protein
MVRRRSAFRRQRTLPALLLLAAAIHGWAMAHGGEAVKEQERGCGVGSEHCVSEVPAPLDE